MKWLFRIFLPLAVFLFSGNHASQATAYHEVRACVPALKVDHARQHFKAQLLPICANDVQFRKVPAEQEIAFIVAEETEDDTLQWTLLKKSKTFGYDLVSIFAPYYPEYSFFFIDRLPFPTHFARTATLRSTQLQVFRI